MSNLAAARVIKNFRLKQLLRVESHIRQLGPLSDHTIPALEPGSKTAVLPNPFIPRKTLTSKKWKPPVYSLRQQVELVKKAKAAGLLHLLPPGPKNPIPATDVKEAIKGIQETPNSMSLETLKHQLKDNKKDKSLWMNPVAWEGRISTRKVRGRELGITLYAGKKRMFKGHKWERARRLKMKKRQMVLKSMERRIHNFKSVSWMFLLHASDFDFFPLVLQAEKARSSQTTEDFQVAQTTFLICLPIYCFAVYMSGNPSNETHRNCILVNCPTGPRFDPFTVSVCVCLSRGNKSFAVLLHRLPCFPSTSIFSISLFHSSVSQ